MTPGELREIAAHITVIRDGHRIQGDEHLRQADLLTETVNWLLTQADASKKTADTENMA